MGCTSNTNMTKNDYNQFHSTISNSELFIDKTFPPENQCIFGIENLKKIEKGEKIKHNKIFSELIDDFNQKKIIWKRAKDIFNNQEYTLFSKDISNNSIIQGSIGNCYFLSILSSLTKYPSILYQLFTSINISLNGYYEIKIKNNHKITTISLDDYFPYNTKTNAPLFCKPYKNEIWAMILEKGWAKIKGGYINIDNGSPYDALDSLLLSSKIGEDIIYKSYFINDDVKYEIWENIVDKFENNKNVMMICLSKDKISNKKKLNNFFYAIVEKHYYTIEDIIKNTDKEKILKLRNPWGFNLKNENYNIKENNFDFIITEIDDDEGNKSKEEENEYLLSGGEFLIDYKYFCYLFQEIQIYEIKTFSFSYFINNNIDEPLFNRLNLIYINLDKNKKNQNRDIEIMVNIENIKEYKKTKDMNQENNYINLLFIIIDVNNITIINRINQKISLSNKKLNNSFPLFIDQQLSKEYYFCLFFTSDSNSFNNKNNNLELHINFKTKDYLDIHYNIKNIPKKEIYDIIKNEFSQYNADLDNIIIDDSNPFKNIDDILCNQKYLEEKYPKEMKLLMELEPMKNNKEKIIFRDKNYYKNNNYYLGEQLYNGNIRHGRGLYYLNKNGNIYIGYNEYGKFVGRGKVIDKDGNIKEGEFINGKLKLN